MPTPTASRSNRYGIDPFGPIYTSPPTVRTAREAKGAIYPFMSSIVLLWIHVTIPIYSTKVPSVSFPFSVVNNCRQHTRKTVLKYRPNQTPPHLRAHERTKRQRRHAAFPSMTSLYLGTAHAPAEQSWWKELKGNDDMPVFPSTVWLPPYLGIAHAPAGDAVQRVLSRAHEKNQKATMTCLSFLLWPLYLLYLGTAHAPAGDAGQRVLTSAILNRHGTTTVTLQRKKIQLYMHFLKNVFQE